MVGFSRQIYRSRLSSKIYSYVRLPTVKNFNHMLSTNIIPNCPISVAYIRNTENIYGSSISSLKVNSIRIKPRTVIKDSIQIPSKIYKNNSDIELCVDVIYINGVAYMVSIDRQVKCRYILINYSYHVS